MMNVIYKIKDNYYLKVGRKYIKITFDIKNDNVSLVPNNKDFIEDDGKLKVEHVNFDDSFKKKIIDSRRPRSTEEKEEVSRSRYR